jgi:hypothetical protein
MRGIMAVDPGGHTGIAWGIVNTNKKLVAEALAELIEFETMTIQIDGRIRAEDKPMPVQRQIPIIAELWRTTFRRWVHKNQLPPDACDFVWEDFQLRPDQRHAGGQEGITPYGLICGVQGYRMGAASEHRKRSSVEALVKQPVMQQPSDATSFASDDKLRKWGLWTSGRDHERSATKHFAFRVHKLLSM